MYNLYHNMSLTQRWASLIWRHKLISGCLIASCYLFGSSGYIHAKAAAAQVLIAKAWQTTLQQGIATQPWAWADTHPVAKLTIAESTMYVLAGASGRTMAFGPGHFTGSALPGELGNAVISGHRDTHFAVLEDVSIDDVISTQTQHGESRYRVTEMRIVHQSQMGVTQSTSYGELTLITCYPFNDVGLNPQMRYVVKARLIK